MDTQLSNATPYKSFSDCSTETTCSPPMVNKIRQINIREVHRGYIVDVGCHTFAVSTKEELTTKLMEYINDPDTTEQKWNDGKLFE